MFLRAFRHVKLYKRYIELVCLAVVRNNAAIYGADTTDAILPSQYIDTRSASLHVNIQVGRETAATRSPGSHDRGSIHHGHPNGHI